MIHFGYLKHSLERHLKKSRMRIRTINKFISCFTLSEILMLRSFLPNRKIPKINDKKKVNKTLSKIVITHLILDYID